MNHRVRSQISKHGLFLLASRAKTCEDEQNIGFLVYGHKKSKQHGCLSNAFYTTNEEIYFLDNSLHDRMNKYI